MCFCPSSETRRKRDHTEGEEGTKSENEQVGRDLTIEPLAGRVWLQRECSAENYIKSQSRHRNDQFLKPGVAAFPCLNMMMCNHCPDQVSPSAP